MKINNFFCFRNLLFPCFLVLVGCAAAPPYNYQVLKNEAPRSILVLPPMNNSLDVNASYTYLSTVTKPLAEKGYYVFPVSVIDNFLKENGLPTPVEMNRISLDKIREHIGADAVLYVTIQNWGQEYHILSSITVVDGYARLVSAKSGQVLWDAPIIAEQSSNDGNQGLIGALVQAAITQIAGNVTDYTPAVSRVANSFAFNDTERGLLKGPYKIGTKKP